MPLNCVNADPAAADRGRLFVCSDLGVHVSDDFGRSWAELGTGLPAVVVQDLDLMSPTRELFAGTHARSLYRFDLTQLGPADADGDGADNTSDCDADDPGVFATPGEVIGLELAADAVTLTWDSAAPGAGDATRHQVLRGAIAGLPVGGTGAETCASAGTTAASLSDPTAPAPGDGFWYLVRATNTCGTGTWGTTSAGQTRGSTTCP